MIDRLRRRFAIRGVFWRHFLQWGVRNAPFYLEPIIIFGWTLLFFVTWSPGRRAVYRNLACIRPESSAVRRLAESFAVFQNFALTFTDTMHYAVSESIMDWEIDDPPSFEELSSRRDGAIIITAHMGNYDLGSYLFGRMRRPLTTVRAPESDPESEMFSRESREKRGGRDGLRVTYGSSVSDLAIDLVDALRRGEIVAIQGDRIVGGVTPFETRLFDQPVLLPAGPFALAMATGASIYPLFVVRSGHRRYRVITAPAIECRRTGRDRDADIGRGIAEWRVVLERVITVHWAQWFTFEPFFQEKCR